MGKAGEGLQSEDEEDGEGGAEVQRRPRLAVHCQHGPWKERAERNILIESVSQGRALMLFALQREVCILLKF